MKRFAIACAAFAVAVGCAEKRKKWLDVRATQIHVGTLEAEIPAGWRDFNELAEKPTFTPPPGSRTLLPENLDSVSEIMVLPLGKLPISGDQCANVAEVWKAQMGSGGTITDVQGASFGGSPGCLMHISVNGLSGTVAIVTPRGGSTVAVRCLGYGIQEPCYQVAFGLHVTPSS